jgi:hypothetical protein
MHTSCYFRRCRRDESRRRLEKVLYSLIRWQQHRNPNNQKRQRKRLQKSHFTHVLKPGAAVSGEGKQIARRFVALLTVDQCVGASALTRPSLPFGPRAAKSPRRRRARQRLNHCPRHRGPTIKPCSSVWGWNKFTNKPHGRLGHDGRAPRRSCVFWPRAR